MAIWRVDAHPGIFYHEEHEGLRPGRRPGQGSAPEGGPLARREGETHEGHEERLRQRQRREWDGKGTRTATAKAATSIGWRRQKEQHATYGKRSTANTCRADFSVVVLGEFHVVFLLRALRGELRFPAPPPPVILSPACAGRRISSSSPYGGGATLGKM